MKLKPHLLLAALICAFTSHAQLPFTYEGFDYGNGAQIHGQTGGFGWQGGWQASTGAEAAYVVTTTSPFAYTNNGQTFPVTPGRMIGSSSGTMIGRYLNTTSNGPYAGYLNSSGSIGTIPGVNWALYFIVFIKKNTIDDNQVYYALTNGLDDTNVQDPTFSIGYFGYRSVNNGTKVWSYRVGNTYFNTGIPIVAGEQQVFIFSLSSSNGSMQFSLWKNPPIMNGGVGTGVANGNQFISGQSNLAKPFKSMILYSEGTGGSVDELLVGPTTNSIVLNIMPPATLTGVNSTVSGIAGTSSLNDTWRMNGNGNTNSTVQFIGTTDNQDLNIRTNNVSRLLIGKDGLSKITGTFKANMLVAYPDATSIDGAFNMYGTADVNSVYTGPNMNFNFNGKISSGGRMVLQEHMTAGDANPLSNYGRMLLSNNLEWDAIQKKYHVLDVGSNSDLQMLRYENHGGMAFYTRNQFATGGTPNETLPDYVDQTTLDQKYRRMSITGHGTVLIGNQVPDVLEILNTSNQNDKLKVYGDTKLYGDLYINDAKVETLWGAQVGGMPGNINYLGGNVGIGTNPTEKLTVFGNIAINRQDNGIVFYDGTILTTAGAGSLWKKNLSNIYADTGVNIGIGTNVPANPLDIYGTTGQTALNIGSGNLNVAATANISNLNVSGATKVTTLYSSGIIHAAEVRACVDPLNTCPPDYVFESDYQLRDLANLKKYLAKNKHLPDVPSAHEMLSNGIGMVEMNMTLLRKVEETVLYVLQLEEKINDLNKKIEQLNAIKK